MEENDFNEEKNMQPEENKKSEKNTNLAITIVVVAGIILGAVLLTNRQAEDAASTVPGAGTLEVAQPMATPPTQDVQVDPTVPSVPASPIQGIVWQWTSVTDQSGSQTTTVPSPQQYTLVFTPQGYVNGNTDCNSFTGTYSLENGLTINVTTMTMAACPEGSLEQQYLQLLDEVVAGGPDGTGSLALETAGGAQRMLFQDGGPAR